MKQKLITGIIAGIILGACSSNNIINATEETTENKIKFISIYNTNDLQTFIDTQFICKTGKDINACNTNKDNLAQQFNFTLNQIGKNNQITQIKAYDIIYQSNGVNNQPRTLSGGILIPDTEKEKIKGVILLYHPTEVTKFNIPSCFLNAQNLPGYCHTGATIHGSTYIEEAGGIFASQGYVVVMPDYIGQGIDSSIMHPYIIHPQINAMSGLNMLQTTRKLLKNIGIDNSTSLNLYLTGYSEGGAYSLWAAKLLQSSAKHILTENSLQLKLTAPISGAYNLSGAQIPFEFTNVASPSHNNKYMPFNQDELTAMKPVVSAYFLTAMAYYHFNKNYDSVLNPDFLSCNGHCKFNDTNYTIPELYTLNDENLVDSNIIPGIKNAALDSLNPENNLAYAADNNSIKSISTDNIFKNKIFSKVIKQADIVSWKSNSPITFIRLDYDSVVTPLNTETAYNGLSKLSDKRLINYISIANSDYMTSITGKTVDDIKPIDHMGCRVFLFIAALDEFNKQQEPDLD